VISIFAFVFSIIDRYYFATIPQMENIQGHIDTITFRNEENGFTVARIKEAGKAGLTWIVGALPSVQVGESLKCEGEWKNNPVYGMQFLVSKYEVEAPSTVIGIEKYLASGLVPGIGPVYAKRIVEKFGEETLKVIDDDPKRLNEVSGIGKKRLSTIITQWSEQKSIREVMIYLQGLGISTGYAQKIYKQYGDDSISKIKTNPYQLARDIWGIGFKTADTVAKGLNIANDAVERIDAGVEYVLSELSTDGHSCYPEDAFLKTAAELLEIDLGKIEKRLKDLANESRIVLSVVEDRPFIWLKSLHTFEKGIVAALERLRTTASALKDIDIDKLLPWAEETLSIKLADFQRQAIRQGLKEKISIITGGPGTGKSTITNAILKITETLTTKITLTAPTGRAAKRLSELTGKPATTIHSLLEYDFKLAGFRRNHSNPLSCELIIIDEASMIDTGLMFSLLSAIPDTSRVIFVGDIHQLPSVGPGNVLKDFLETTHLPAITLTEIFRQAQGSRIITNAHLINQGQFPDIRVRSSGDFFFLEEAEPEDILETIQGLVAERLPKAYDWSPINDIQVLTPQNRGIIGTLNLNTILQEKLNPNGESLSHRGKEFRVGDKVMQLRNNYQKEVFNGDLGIVTEINADDQQVLVQIDNNEICYEYRDLDELSLAYAVTVHKFQGSEYPCIIMPIHTTHYRLLHRNLLYTGVTRGKKLVVLVGTKKALYIAVNRDDVKKRFTGLGSFFL